LRFGGSDGGEELADDAIESLDLTGGDIEVLAEWLALGAHFLQATLQELEVNGEGVERIAQLVGDACGEHGEGIQALAFELLLGAFPCLGDIADEHDKAHGGILVLDGGDVEVQEAVFGIKDLHVAADDGAGCHHAVPVQAANALGEALADDGIFFHAEELAGGTVHIGDLAFGIEEDDAFLKRLEDLFQEAFFTQQLQHDALHLAGFEAVHAFDELIDEGGAHGGALPFRVPCSRLKALRRRSLGALDDGFHLTFTVWIRLPRLILMDLLLA
jgi:hypothetical protein